MTLLPGIRSFEQARPALEAMMAQRFTDGDRVVVPVIGSGVNKQAAYEVGDTAHDWEQLLAEIEATEGIVWDGTPPRSMTARWEALTQRQSAERASEREDMLVSTVVEALERQTERIWAAGGGQAPPLYRELLGKGFRDLISLNFDDRLERAAEAASDFNAISPKDMQLREGASFSVLPQLYRRVHLARPRFARLWYPHGRTQARRTIVLGVGCYGRLIPDLDIGWRRYKSAERDFCEGPTRDAALFPEPVPRRQWSDEQVWRWVEHRRAEGPYLESGKLARRLAYRRPFDCLSWLDVFLMSPLLFLGCGLGSDEFPLWWALHQRARNQARQPPHLRTPAVLLTAVPADHPTLHYLHGGPGGLCTVLFPSWNELWGFVRAV